MRKKFAVISDGVVYGYYDNIQDAEEFIKNQTLIHPNTFILEPEKSFKIVKIEKVYKLTKIDENKEESLYGFKETTNDDETDYDTVFDDLNIYGDGYDW